MAFRMAPAAYAGPVWQDGWIDPALTRLLEEKDRLIELSAGKPSCVVVIGVPHHAASGVGQIALDWTDPRTQQRGRAADENTAYNGIALLAACQERGINARLVIAAHATDHDPNKTAGSPYCQAIFQPPHPLLLFEMHGCGPNHRHDLEISAGKNSRADAPRFAKILSGGLPGTVHLAAQKEPGRWAALSFASQVPGHTRLEMPALQTYSLQHADALGFGALHLEMTPAFRALETSTQGLVRPNPLAWQLARACAQAIETLAGEDPRLFGA